MILIDVYFQNAVVVSRLEIHGQRSTICEASKPENFAISDAHQNAGVMAVAEFREPNGALAFDGRIAGGEQFFVIQTDMETIVRRFQDECFVRKFSEIENLSVGQFFGVLVREICNQAVVLIDCDEKLVCHRTQTIAFVLGVPKWLSIQLY